MDIMPRKRILSESGPNAEWLELAIEHHIAWSIADAPYELTHYRTQILSLYTGPPRYQRRLEERKAWS